MANISAKDVAELRKRTGAGMMECKKALAENAGDFDKATEWLRARGIAQSERRGGRGGRGGGGGGARDLPAEVIERERRIYTEQVAQEGKPEAVRAKIVEGKLRKFYAESVLLEQPWVKDDKQTIGDLVKGVSGKLGEKVVLRRFIRLQLGEAG